MAAAGRKAIPAERENQAGQRPLSKVPDHLAQTGHERAVTDFEQALICAAEGFYRFAAAIMGPAARAHNLSGQDNVILQLLMTAGRPRGVADLSRFANRDDIANIQYSLRKLIKAGLVEKVPGAAPRETAYRVTADGRALTQDLIARRREMLMDPTAAMPELDRQLAEATRVLGLVTGLYDHGSRMIAGRD